MTIAQNIREAAIYFPKVFLGDVESEILDVFKNDGMLWEEWRVHQLFKEDESYKFYEEWSLTYMLIVAEALE